MRFPGKTLPRTADLLLVALTAGGAATVGCDTFQSGDGTGGGGASSTSSSGSGGSTSGSGGTGATAGSGGTTSSGSGGTGGSGGSGGSVTHVVASCGAGDLNLPITLWTTLNNMQELQQPGIGSGQNAYAPQGVGFVPTSDDYGVMLNGGNHYAEYQQSDGSHVNLNPRKGAIDLCFSPGYHTGDNLNHAIFAFEAGSNAFFAVRKASDGNLNALRITLNDGVSGMEYNVLPAAFTFVANQWYRLTIGWRLQAPESPKVYVAIDGQPYTPTSSATPNINMPGPSPNAHFYLGAGGHLAGLNPLATFDEFHVYAAFPN
ncbi:MAG: hypothetical protein JRI68_05920 [Deltaproteobacteria bacterium]|nr:hypothetical protein [Deltaproteobacteria bacterium]